MADLTKEQLTALNNANFINNNSGFITPQKLREFNQDMIDSMVTDIDSILTGSITVDGTVTATEFVGDGSGITGVTSEVPQGTVSGSSQVIYEDISDIPSGIVSGSSQVSYNGITDVPSGIISSSEQLPAGLVSGSVQIDYPLISNIPSGIISSSEQLPSGLVSGSSQISDITGSSLVTASFASQTLTFTKGDGSTFDITIPDESGSALPSGTVSGSSQIDYPLISNIPSGIISSSEQLPSGVVSGSSQLTASYDERYQLSGSDTPLPSGTVSSSQQIVDYDIFATTGSNVFVGNQTITGEVTASRLQINGITDLNGTLSVSNDTTINGDVRIQSATPNLKLRDTSGGGFSSGYDLRVDTGSFEIYDDTHNRDVLSDFFNTGTSKHTTSLTSEIIVISGSDSVTIQGQLTASLQEGYAWVGDSSGKNQQVSTASWDAHSDLTQLNLFTQSQEIYNAGINSYTQSTDVTIGNIETYVTSSSQRIDLIEDFTSSQELLNTTFATTGSNTFRGDQTIIDDLILSGSSNPQLIIQSTTGVESQLLEDRLTFQSGSYESSLDRQSYGGKVIMKGSSEAARDYGLLTVATGSMGLYYGTDFGYFDGKSVISIDRTTEHITIGDDLTVNGDVSASNFTGSFVGDGSGLTGIIHPTGSFATTGSNQFIGDQGITGSLSVLGVSGSGNNPLDVKSGYNNGDRVSIGFFQGDFSQAEVQFVALNSTFQSTGALNFNTRLAGGSNTLLFDSNKIIISSSTALETSTPILTVANPANTIRPGLNTQYGGAVGLFDTATNNEINLILKSEEWGYPNNWTGPSISGNDTGDTYPALIGFQGKDNWTDGTVTILKPLDVSGSLNLSDNAFTITSGSNSVEFNGKFNDGQAGVVFSAPNSKFNSTGNFNIQVNGIAAIDANGGINLNNNTTVNANIFQEQPGGANTIYLQNPNFFSSYYGNTLQWNPNSGIGGNSILTVAEKAEAVLQTNAFSGAYDSALTIKTTETGTIFADWDLPSYGDNVWLSVPDQGTPTFTRGANISTVMNLTAQDPLPAGTVGDLAVSGSNLYFYNGAWTQVV
jgi:hypothetical protein